MLEGRIGCEIEYYSNYGYPEIYRNNLSVVRVRGWRLSEELFIPPPLTRPLEMKSPPVPINDVERIIDDFKEIKHVMTGVNSDCGIHFHISVNEKEYVRLKNFSFVDSFQKKIKNLFTLPEEKKRFQNEYCQFYADEREFESTNNTLGRRHSISFLHQMNKPKTIEFRVFPSTKDPEKLREYAALVIETTGGYLINLSSDY